MSLTAPTSPVDSGSDEPDRLLERPGVRPAGMRDLVRDLGAGYVSNGLIGLIFSASGPIAVTLAVGAAGGLTEAQLASWVFAIFLSAGLATVVMSLVYRQPFGFAWSIPGTVLLGPSLQHLSFAEVVGAFFGAGVLVLALGSTGVVRRVVSAIPMPIVMAMVAAVFLRFGTDIVTSTRDNPVVAAPMVVAFVGLTALPVLGRFVPPVLGALIVGVVAVVVSGQFVPAAEAGAILASPTFTVPEFTWAAQLELVVPLAVTVLVVQNGQGVAVLRAAGHRPPINVFAIVSGLFSLVNAGFGAVSACVTGPTNALLTSSGVKHRQYTAAVVYGLLSLVCAVLAPGLVRFLLATPEAFVSALGGIAMLGALRQAFVVAFSTKFTLGALITFVVTIADPNLLGIHAAFWGILVGYVLSRMLERDDHVSAP
ncbi:MAG: benzoate transporter [Rhodococcus sp.]|uniref:benzoate/H(+) symporter BenE family transporter n=1 Tax=Rhodococcus TaxID=1827 RepID=UPI00169ABDF0|nr:benzoate/H(+) symporter BenE family transporter [Rhodococcus sp. (in: high G+C Gram-positive bacteria)]NLV80237.1 benzoate transporter [Rhodococcus sp. (in: high G+C Gram-positive bacteria)]